MKPLPKILVIDDEPDNFDVIDALLDNEGYALSYVANGQQALDLMAFFQPDVILLDVMMPQMNGIQFCEKFKSNSQWKHIPVIMVTALTAKEDLSQCMAVGADDFISKPVNGMELRSRVRSMLRIKQQYDALQETLHLREDLSNMIVHDLRNPLTSIILAAEMLRISHLPPERQFQKSSQIIAAAQQLRSMIDSLLLLAKLDSGKLILQRTDVDLYELCVAAITDIEPSVIQKNIKLISDLPQPGGSISLDANLFRRVLDNLLSNAIKFTHPHSEIIVHADYPAPGKAKIQVFDSGPGVKEELREVIFEKYEIGTFNKAASQIGLGLAFCKMTVEAHGGNIKVESNQPAGAIFTIEIDENQQILQHTIRR
ncbi:hybrid sensor histidine kinase/response regulator [Anabaena cylindrica FACHB-243]|nr:MULTISPECIES: hybrid sensor histidine kinase/response regulator [Anabaena]MBD2418793.1 hybrid sensor histidine kinase/response regulator [Anabaena cylindrica FACHB-243]MBY5283301.1 hybrid sensor histidine kinase/response regulator [Anabaena sp. CCAP 1446/1C]MBY5306776.1 hybrid sensor histidine kinase/response regulator [Anabaena sp. CCAP 1446/1C]MCM2406358.1 hybrid sensor histidine kinase/response regulator [Anabaena sp. CCAP 1446/1C]